MCGTLVASLDNEGSEMPVTISLTKKSDYKKGTLSIDENAPGGNSRILRSNRLHDQRQVAMRRASSVVVAVGLVLAACSLSRQRRRARPEDDLAKRAHHYVDVSAAAPMTGVARDKILRALVASTASRRGRSPLRRARSDGDARAHREWRRSSPDRSRRPPASNRWHNAGTRTFRSVMDRRRQPMTTRGAATRRSRRSWRRTSPGISGATGSTSRSRAFDVDEPRGIGAETDHVSERSGGYYRVIETHVVEPDPAYVEEYRAFLSECFFDEESATVATCSTFAKGRVDEYGFAAKLSRVLPNKSDDPQKLTELILAAEPDGAAPFGRIVPRKRDWARSFGACPVR